MRRSSTAVALLAILTLLSVACGSTKDTGFPPTPDPVETEDHGGNGDDESSLDNPTALDGDVEVVDNRFVPRFAAVAAGTTVTWVQTGAAPHNIVADDGSYDSHPDCLSDIGSCMARGDEYSMTFDEPGEYPYYCVIHGRPGALDDPVNMAGMIIVE